MTEQIHAAYQKRLNRVMQAVHLQEPDRVPNMTIMEAFPCYYAGISIQEAQHDYSRAAAAFDTFFEHFKPDLGWDPVTIYSAKVMSTPGFQLLRWPGHGIDDPNQMYQFIEEEYMKAEDYDAFIADPTHYLQSTYIPRIFSKLQGLRHLDLRNVTWNGFFSSFASFASDEVRSAFDILVKTAEELGTWFGFLADYEQKMKEKWGIPTAWGTFGYAPFDSLGDSMRGTVGILKDLYDRPDKVLKAVEKMLPINIDATIQGCQATGRPFVWIWLHKGLDSFMSNEHFKTFYWPTLQQYIIALTEAGLVPILYAEGSWNSRLEIIRDLPRGKVIYDFEHVDMARAKKVLGDVGCIAGNVPNYLLAHGSQQEVQDYCKQLIDDCAPGGGFIMDTGALVDNAKPENLEMMFATTETYGRYS
ncbi:MAG: uroporphyrinogen decarboxylase family protein [Spirochaetota bacterium]